MTCENRRRGERLLWGATGTVLVPASEVPPPKVMGPHRRVSYGSWGGSSPLPDLPARMGERLYLVVNAALVQAGEDVVMTERQCENFLNKIGSPDADGCWPWMGALDRYGYGKFNVTPRLFGAHRVAYQLLIGPIPTGLDLDHLCRVPACVNPAHLEPVTRRENTMRSPIAPAAVNAAKTACVNGHDFTEASTSIDRRGWRHCKVCARLARTASTVGAGVSGSVDV